MLSAVFTNRRLVFSFMLFNEILRFLSEIDFDIFIVSNSKNTIFEYSLFGTTFFLEIEFLLNSGSKTLPKG